MMNKLKTASKSANFAAPKLKTMPENLIERLEDIVRRASALMVPGGFEVSRKDGLANIVTSSDIAVQHFLISELSALLPGSGFLCEEEDLRELSGEYVWIVDPIDGTANYSRGISDCCISVALAEGSHLQAGVVYSPWKGEFYSALRGGGAYLDGKPIRSSARPFEDGLLCTAMSTYRKEFAKTCSDIIYDIYMRCNDTRRFGSAALELCMLARGMVDLYFEMRLQPWDYAAASLILTEAGGAVAGYDGKEPSLEKPSLVVAANCRDNLEMILETVHRYL